MKIKVKEKRRLKSVVIFFVAGIFFCLWNACSSSPPTLQQLSGTILSTSGITANSIIVTGTTGVSGATSTPLTLTFSTTMNGSTLNNLTLNCKGGSTNLATVSPTTNQSTYTINFSNPLPQVASCILTLPESIQAANGKTLIGSSITFTTGCQTSDDFSNANTLIDCWNRTASTGTESANPVIIDNSLIMTQVTASGSNLFAASNVNKNFSTFSTSANGTIVTFQVSASSLLDLFSACYVAFASNSSETPAQNNNGTLVVSADGITWAAGYYSSGFVLEPQPSAINSYFCFELNASGQFQYGTGATAATCAPNNTVTNTSLSPNAGGVIILGAYNFGGTVPVTCTFSNFEVSGVTATGPVYQY